MVLGGSNVRCVVRLPPCGVLGARPLDIGLCSFSLFMCLNCYAVLLILIKVRGRRKG